MNKWNKESAKAYIEKNIEINETTGCHEWQGPKTKDGYGQVGPTALYQEFGIKGAHRLAVHLYHGHYFKDRNEQVLHSCHCRSCCNPEHLRVGTASENMNELETLRNLSAALSNRPAMRTMNEATVIAARAMYAAGVKIATIARVFEISWTTAQYVVTRKTWRWVAG